MKRILLVISGLLLLGAGCTSNEISSNRRAEWERVIGTERYTKAVAQEGSDVVVHAPAIQRRFESKISPVFTDHNGVYRFGDTATVEVQLGVSGTIEDDLRQYKSLERLLEFDTISADGWTITTAYDEAERRHVLRAIKADPGFNGQGYHVIECLADEMSDIPFWDGCRTVIQHARIIVDGA